MIMLVKKGSVFLMILMTFFDKGRNSIHGIYENDMIDILERHWIAFAITFIDTLIET